MAKSTIGKIALIAGVGAAAYLGLTMLAKASGGDNSNPQGTLGGDSLTAEGNPFARIDPNSYPSQGSSMDPVNDYFLVQPDGSVVKTETDPSSGDFWTGANPSDPQFSYDPNAGSQPANQPGANIAAPKWYDSALGQALIFGGGIAAGDIAIRGASGKLKDVFKGPSAKDLELGASVKEGPLRASRNPSEKIFDDLGIPRYSPEGKLIEARALTDADVVRGPKLGEKLGQAGEVAGKALIVGHVVNRMFGAYNEYGTQLLEQKGGYTPGEGYASYITPESKAKAVGMTAAKGTTNILADLFGFTTGLVYRPETKLQDLQGQKTGWFATEQDLYDYAKYGLQDPMGALKGLFGYDQLAAAVTGSNDAQKPTNPAAYTAPPPPMKSTSDKIFVAMQGPAPATPTQTSVSVPSPAASSSGRESSSLKINPTTGTYEASSVKLVQPARDSSGKTAMDRQVEANKKASDAKKAAGKTFKGYDSKGKAVWK